MCISLDLTIHLDAQGVAGINVQANPTHQSSAPVQSTDEAKEDEVRWAIPDFSLNKKVKFGKSESNE